MLKIDLHIHTGDDPVDRIPYSSARLLYRAAELGFDAVAITLHDRQMELTSLSSLARSLGLILIPGIERTVHGRHVLLLNFPRAAEGVKSFADIAALKARYPRGLVVAPHPFFPHRNCLREQLDAHAELFDAIELNAFYCKTVDFNRRALRWAETHARPILANSDAHRLPIFGRTFSSVDAARDPDSICEAIRRGAVTVQTAPIALPWAAWYFASLTVNGLRSPVRSEEPMPFPA
jgi:predicted metal-dependent phosphoesterase TrpH